MRTIRKSLLYMAITTVLFACSTISVFAETCRYYGCGRTAISSDWNRRYCSTHAKETHYCRYPNCMEEISNYSSDRYCKKHGGSSAGKSSGSSSKSVGSNYCLETGCYNTQKTTGLTWSSLYCSKHTCSEPGCRKKALTDNGKCNLHKEWTYSSSYSGKSSTTSRYNDPYDVDEYDDPDDFWYDHEDEFEDYEDAEDYYDEHHR